MELRAGVAATLRFPAAGEDAAAFAAKAEVKVTVTRDSDGEEIIKAAKAVEAEEGKVPYWTIELESKEIPEVDLLTAVWTDGSSTYTTEHEIVGGFVVSLGAIEDQLGEEATTAKLTEAREIALRRIESACGVAFRPRYARELLDGSGRKELLLGNRRPLRVISAEVEESKLSEAELEDLTLKASGVLVRESLWTAGSNNVVIVYVHGYQSYPEAIEPVRDLAAYYLMGKPTDWNERATSVATELGTYSLVTPGVRGATFPLPSVNAFIQGFAVPLVG